MFYEAVAAPTSLTGPQRASGVTECFFMINSTEKNTDAVKLTLQSIEFDTEVRVYETEETETITRLNAIQTYVSAACRTIGWCCSVGRLFSKIDTTLQCMTLWILKG